MTHVSVKYTATLIRVILYKAIGLDIMVLLLLHYGVYGIFVFVIWVQGNVYRITFKFKYLLAKSRLVYIAVLGKLHLSRSLQSVVYIATQVYDSKCNECIQLIITCYIATWTFILISVILLLMLEAWPEMLVKDLECGWKKKHIKCELLILIDSSWHTYCHIQLLFVSSTHTIYPYIWRRTPHHGTCREHLDKLKFKLKIETRR